MSTQSTQLAYELVEDMAHDALKSAAEMSPRLRRKYEKYGEAVVGLIAFSESPYLSKSYVMLGQSEPTIFPEELAEIIEEQTNPIAERIGRSALVSLSWRAKGLERSIDPLRDKVIIIEDNFGEEVRITPDNYVRKVWAPDYSERLANAWLLEQPQPTFDEFGVN